MTPTSYYIALIAKSFGYERRHKRLADASSEMTLLREAEYQLGHTLWEQTEPVEELSVEYWNLRKYIKERDQLLVLLEGLNEKLIVLQEERAGILNENSPDQDRLFEDRAELHLHLEKLAAERDAVVRRAKEIRRTHEGLLTKIEVLQRDGSSEQQVQLVRATVENLKQEFRELKELRQKIADELEQGDQMIDKIEEKMAEIRQEKRERASVIFQQMGSVNRDLSDVRSAMGECETHIRHLQAEVGRYISRYSKRNPKCGEIAKQERTMIEVMRMLRISIVMNHRLADFK
jgi:chromosome segregation ATPase